MPDEELRAALERLAGVPRLLVALDFDGTLSPIVRVPSDARPLPEAAAAVEALAARNGTTVVLVSGRGRADLAAVSGIGPPVRLIGSHGFETDDGGVALDDTERARLAELNEELVTIVGDTDGVRLEGKPGGTAVHVRAAAPDDRDRVLSAVRSGPGARSDVTVTPGKQVLDLAVREVTKGTAVEDLRERLGVDAVFFAGDDVTDETVFARLRPGDVGVKVGDGETAAAHRVADPQALAAVLAVLVDHQPEKNRSVPRG
jgi:trehalose 6-phosphate phosphatase